jgi:bifunctional oligoribonuclease and PAP phosphatase NrnA
MKAIQTLIEQANSIIMIAHVRPDGDCIGASEGLRHAILHRFPNKQVYCRYEALDAYAFLGKPDDVTNDVFSRSLVISLDTANQERIYDQRYASGKQLVRIDHHPHIDQFGDIDYVDPSSPSTCNIITRLLTEWGYEIPTAAAVALFTGITTDTGRFRYRGVTPETLKQAAALLETGIDITEVYQPLYQKHLNDLQFMGHVLTKVQSSANGILYVLLTQSDIQAYDLTDDTAANVVDQLSDVKGYPIWFVVYQTKEGDLRVRLRSDRVAIDQVAMKYQGGGHPFASGCRLTSFDDVTDLLHDLESLL